MFIINALALSLLAVVYVATPLFRRYKDDVFAAAAPDRIGEFRYQKELALATIRDLDFDMQTGKLAESDHAELVAAQQRLIAQTEQQLAHASTPRKGQSSGLCPACGQSLAPAARFCSQCGATVATSK